MKTIMDERPFVEGYYVKVKIGGFEFFCTPTLFKTERDALRWKDRYQNRVRGGTVYIEPVTCEEKR